MLRAFELFELVNWDGASAVAHVRRSCTSARCEGPFQALRADDLALDLGDISGLAFPI
jgi:hypothetical protein